MGTMTYPDTSHLRHLGTVKELAPTSGQVTLANSSDIFTGHIDPNFKYWGTDKSGKDTEATAALFYEMKQDGTFDTLFSSFGVDLFSLAWQQGQIREFCASYRHLLQQDVNSNTFFLFEVNGQLFVARVYVFLIRRSVNLCEFWNETTWDTRRRNRLVVPEFQFN